MYLGMPEFLLILSILYNKISQKLNLSDPFS